MRRLQVDEPVASILVEDKGRVLATDGGVLQDEIAAAISSEHIHRGATDMEQLDDFPALTNAKRSVRIGWLDCPPRHRDRGEIAFGF